MMNGLECGECGDIAIYHENDLYMEDEGARCMSCGHPGHVNVREDDDMEFEEDSDKGVAYWSADESCDIWCRHAEMMTIEETQRYEWAGIGRIEKMVRK